MVPLIERWEAIRGHIRTLRPQAALVAVGKTHPAAAIEPLLEAGQLDFAENRVSEAQAKWPALKIRYPQARLHLIGPLQSNKVKEALGLFDVFHTIDRESLVDALMKQSKPEKREAKQFFLQVNTGEEPQKAGVAPAGTATLLDYCRRSGLAISGLMCIPPANESPAPHFALLRTLAEERGLDALSMGMSGDYETALRLGATHVRIGTAIFGERR